MKKKINNLIKRFKKNIKHLNKTSKNIHEDTNINIVYIFFDILYSIVFFGVSIDEYKYYEFYNINSTIRESYLTKRKHNRILRKLVDKNIIDVINNKDRFYRRFNSYIKRDVKNTKQLSYKQFEDMILENKKVLCRSISKNFISSYKVFNLKDYRGPGFILEEIKNNNLLLVEKMFEQNKILNSINNDLVVLNIVTINNKGRVKIISSNISFKENNKIVYGYVDIKTSNTKGHFIYEDGKQYSNNVTEYVIPDFEKCCEYVKKIALELEEIGEIKWSLCINSKDEIYLMDASLWEDYYFSQLREYLNSKVGIVSKYRGI